MGERFYCNQCCTIANAETRDHALALLKQNAKAMTSTCSCKKREQIIAPCIAPMEGNPVALPGKVEWPSGMIETQIIRGEAPSTIRKFG